MGSSIFSTSSLTFVIFFFPFFFFIVVTLVDVKCLFIVILISISLMTNEVEHFFHLVTICLSSLEKCLVRSFAHFFFFLNI